MGPSSSIQPEYRCSQPPASPQSLRSSREHQLGRSLDRKSCKFPAFLWIPLKSGQHSTILKLLLVEKPRDRVASRIVRCWRRIRRRKTSNFRKLKRGRCFGLLKRRLELFLFRPSLAWRKRLLKETRSRRLTGRLELVGRARFSGW